MNKVFWYFLIWKIIVLNFKAFLLIHIFFIDIYKKNNHHCQNFIVYKQFKKIPNILKLLTDYILNDTW